MAKRLYVIFLLSLFVFPLLVSCGSMFSPGIKPPEVDKGVLDLSNWDFKNNGPVELKGEWEFYWEKLLNAENFQQENFPEKTGYISLPGLWNGYKIDGKPISGHGYCTYRLIIKLKNSPQLLGIKMPTCGTSYSLLVNGELLAQNGKVGTNRDTSEPQSLPQTVEFLSKEENIEILLQVSNFRYFEGGAWDIIEFGSVDHIQRKRDIKVALNLFLFGSLIIMSLYHFGLFKLRRKDPSVLYFGIICFMMGLRGWSGYAGMFFGFSLSGN
ncbi:MAG: hypothetical protein GY754_27820 [bacterium]|nr:hypothetical protein [bacterium]